MRVFISYTAPAQPCSILALTFFLLWQIALNIWFEVNIEIEASTAILSVDRLRIGSVSLNTGDYSAFASIGYLFEQQLWYQFYQLWACMTWDFSWLSLDTRTCHLSYNISSTSQNIFTEYSCSKKFQLFFKRTSVWHQKKVTKESEMQIEFFLKSWSFKFCILCSMFDAKCI